MGISRYTLYKYVRIDGTWRYCKAAYHDNNKIKPDIVFVNVKEGLLEKHPEGCYYMSHNGWWWQNYCCVDIVRIAEKSATRNNCWLARG
jgi:hypothetical protein